VPRLIAPDGAVFAGLPFEVVPDLVAAGALGALYTAIATSPTPYVLAIAGDLPFVSAPFLAALVARRGEAEAIVPRPGGRWQPLCGVYHRDVAPRLRNRIDRGQWRVTDALEELTVGAMTDAELTPFDPDGRLLLNVNTPEDLRVATRHAALEE
jgi:molybdopterin-guanine dinucleotide biosynthesis protein A